jgi:large subunit ribosomal protein L9
LAAQPVRIPARAGEDGRLFGSVTAADVATELAKHGTEVDRRDVRLEEPIRSVGVHEVQVHLAHDVVATVTVEVVAE